QGERSPQSYGAVISHTWGQRCGELQPCDLPRRGRAAESTGRRPVDVVHDAVGLRLLRAEDEVAVEVGHDRLDRLASVLGEELLLAPTEAGELLGLDADVLGLSLDASVRLV